MRIRSPPVLLVIAAGCGGAGPAAEAPPGTAAAALPDVARIVCDGETNRLLTPAVRPQRDGVHGVVENRGPADLSFSHRMGGEDADRGTSEHVLTYARGRSGWAA